MSAQAIGCADVVEHLPTGERWIVRAVNGDDLHPCGWPETRARLSHCRLITKATPAERLRLGRQLLESPRLRQDGIAALRALAADMGLSCTMAMHLSVRGKVRALLGSNCHWTELKHPDGRPMDRDAAVEALFDLLKTGKEVVPLNKTCAGRCHNAHLGCPGFQFDGDGCPGHYPELANIMAVPHD